MAVCPSLLFTKSLCRSLPASSSHVLDFLTSFIPCVCVCCIVSPGQNGHPEPCCFSSAVYRKHSEQCGSEFSGRSPLHFWQQQDDNLTSRSAAWILEVLGRQTKSRERKKIIVSGSQQSIFLLLAVAFISVARCPHLSASPVPNTAKLQCAA